MQEDSRMDIGRFSDLDQKRNDHVAEDMMINFSESGHPVFRGTSAWERGALKNKGGGKLPLHFCGDPQTVEVVLRTIISVNQLKCQRSSGGYVRRTVLEDF